MIIIKKIIIIIIIIIPLPTFVLLSQFLGSLGNGVLRVKKIIII